MMVDDEEVQRRLATVVEQLARGSESAEDLMQEALICLWRLEQARPGQSACWYLQGCRFHLQNYLRRGRSLDSAKRSWSQILEREPKADASALPEERAEEYGWDELSARDIVSVLSRRLRRPAERLALMGLADGMSAREIAGRMRVSHTVVNRYRQTILTVARSLGIDPPGGLEARTGSNGANPRP